MAERVHPKGPTPRGLRASRLGASARLLLAALWRRLAGTSGSYRPERHYMRGPGPKWHERNAGNRA